MQKILKCFLALILFCEAGILVFRFYEERQVPQEASIPLQENPVSSVDVNQKNQDQAFVTLVMDLVEKYYVHADRLPYGKWWEASVKNLQENEYITYTASTRMVSKEGRTHRISIPTNRGEFLTQIYDIGDWLNRQQGRVEEKGSSTGMKDLSRGYQLILESVIQSLDPHSMLLTHDVYADLKQTTEGQFGGLGVMIHMENSRLWVSHVLPHSPAFRQGIAPSDQIISIGGISTYGLSMDAVTSVMKGEVGSLIRLGILKAGEWAPRDLLLRREMIQVPAVESREMEVGNRHVLYLKVATFSQHTTEDTWRAIQRAEKKHSLHGIILDLRDNPGGLLDEATHMASLFIPKGPAVLIKGQMEEAQMILPLKDKISTPMITLMNDRSASASEILAGALKDYHRSVILGTRSYGKASVQTIFELPYGHALKLTIARYYTPHGVSIQDTGIVPDIWLQSVAKRQENWDLLGEDRYRKERFLLESNYVSEASYPTSPLRGYFLSSGSKERDPLLEVGLDVVLREDPFSAIKQQSSPLREKLAVWSKKVQTYLHEVHHLQWAFQSSTYKRSVVPISVSLAWKELILHPHTPATLTYRVENQGEESLQDLSLVFSDTNGLLPPIEALVGILSSHGTFQGTLRLQFPEATPLDTLQVQVVNQGILQEVPVQSHSFHVEPFPESHLQVKTQFVAPHQVLSTGEEGVLKVWLKNEGKNILHHIVTHVQNLAGKQIEIPGRGKSEDSQELAPGESTLVEIPILGSKTILSQYVDVGLNIEGEGLRAPIRKSIRIPTMAFCEM